MFFYCSSLSMLTVQIKVAMKTQVSGRVQLNPMMFKSIWFQRVPKAQLWFTMVHMSFELHQPFFLQTFVGARPSSSRGSISWWTTGRHRQGASALVAFWICSCICFVAAPPTQPTSSRSAYCICLVSGLAALCSNSLSTMTEAPTCRVNHFTLQTESLSKFSNLGCFQPLPTTGLRRGFGCDSWIWRAFFDMFI